MIYFWLTFEIFHLEKADFNLYKEFSMKKMPQLCHMSKTKLCKLPDFSTKFKQIAKSIDRCLSFFTFKFSGSQICYSNLLMDDCHFQYKVEKKPLIALEFGT
jgi:hypothetical protein